MGRARGSKKVGEKVRVNKTTLFDDGVFVC